MRKKMRQRDMDDTELNERLEPTLGSVNSSSTKPGDIRAISVEEYKKQIEEAKKSEQNPDELQLLADDPYEPAPLEKSTWKKAASTIVGVALVAINVALIYVEVQPKILKPTLSVATPWGVAEVWTPWGTEANKVAQLQLGPRPMPAAEKESRAGDTGYYDNYDK